MRVFAVLLGLLSTFAMAQESKPRNNEPVLLMRDTCDPPTAPVAKNVFAISCGGDEVLLLLMIKRDGKMEPVWERQPHSELRRLTQGIRYRVVKDEPK